jgi:hypothetical protein
MRRFMKLCLATGAGVFALASVGLDATKAADMGYPQGEYEGPPPQAYVPPPQAYGPPPVEESYSYPRPVAYIVPPPPAPYYEYGPPYVAVPGPYYVRGPYWRGYPPHYAYGYGHWGHGYRRW